MADAPTPTLTGPKVLLEGPSGTGKTYALGTLVDWAARQDPPIPVCALFIEQGLETLLGYWADRGKPVPDNLFWQTAYTKPVSLKQLIKAAGDTGRMTYEGLTKMQDFDRANNNGFEKILMACADFTDERTGRKMGSLESWPARHIFLCDSLSEFANAAMKMVIGSKPTASQPDYGVAQNNLMNWLRLVTQGCSCTFVMTAHVDREKDEITGSIKLMTSAVGKAMAKDIPQLFSDVIYTWREGATWWWDTATSVVDVKTRNLPINSKIPPDFAQIMDKWVARTTAAQA